MVLIVERRVEGKINVVRGSAERRREWGKRAAVTSTSPFFTIVSILVFVTLAIILTTAKTIENEQGA